MQLQMWTQLPTVLKHQIFAFKHGNCSHALLVIIDEEIIEFVKTGWHHDDKYLVLGVWTEI